jgi:protein-L-isoaspartate(D-aspartate) O-methyltransferase
MNKQELLESLKKRGFSDKITNAFEKVDRGKFIPEKYAKHSYEDIALPTIDKQTISQPYTIAFMLKILNPKDKQKILEIGSGSGYVLALLSEMCPNSKIFGIERIKKLIKYSSKRLSNYKNIKIIHKNGAQGLYEKSPFDRILVSASAEEIPLKLIEQLNDQGILVIPVGNSIIKIKKSNKKTYTEKYYGFSFVPLIE